MAREWSRLLAKLVVPDKARPTIWRYGLAMLLPFVALAITTALFTVDRSPFFPLFTAAILAIAVYGGVKPGLLATFISLLLNALTLPPKVSFLIANPEDVLRLVTFGVVAIVLTLLVGTIGDLQRKVELERERLQVTLASIGDGVIGTDIQGHITFMNSVAEEGTGWTLSEASGRPLESIFRIFNEKTRKPVTNPVQVVFQTGVIAGLANHTVLVRRDGSEIPIDDSAAPIRDVHGRFVGVILIFRDISQQRKAEASLIQAEKLASVGRLASTIAHEINNPLGAVSNLLFLMDSAPDLSTARSFAETAQQQLRRAAHAARQTLSFARPTGRRDQVDVGQLAAEILSLYRNRLQSKQVVVTAKYSADGVAFADPSEVSQVVANLVANAVDALPHHGQLYIRVHSGDIGGRRMTRLVVADTGEGIAKQHMERIFEPFFTTKKDVGTGLGLWVTKQIVDAHGGRIHVRSRTGRGTVVSVHWPVSESESGVAAPAS